MEHPMKNTDEGKHSSFVVLDSQTRDNDGNGSCNSSSNVEKSLDEEEVDSKLADASTCSNPELPSASVSLGEEEKSNKSSLTDSHGSASSSSVAMVGDDVFSSSTSSGASANTRDAPLHRQKDVVQFASLMANDSKSSGSSSAPYPETPGSHRSEDTPEILSSPEFHPPTSLPFHAKHMNTSSSSSSSSSLVIQSKKKEKYISDPKVHSTPFEISSEEKEGQPSVSEYSMPSILSSIGSQGTFPEFSGSSSDEAKSLSQKSQNVSALPKWIMEDRERKKIEFHSSSSESAQHASSSSLSNSPTIPSMEQVFKNSSEVEAQRSEEHVQMEMAASQDLFSASSTDMPAKDDEFHLYLSQTQPDTDKVNANADKVTEEGCDLVRSIVRIITTTKIVETVTRTFIQEYRSFDDTLLKEISYEEKESPRVKETRSSSSPRQDVISVSDLNKLDIDLDQKGSPNSRRGTKRSCATPKKSLEGCKRQRKASLRIEPTTSEIAEPTSSKNEKEERYEEIDFEKRIEATLAEEAVTRRQTRSHAKSIEPTGTLRSLDIGMRGFGKWKDNCYYPGCVTEKLDNQRFTMNFDDGNKLVLPAKSIVACKVLARGQKVFARDSGNFYRGTILDVVRPDSEETEVEYEIQFDNESSSNLYKIAEIMLNGVQVAEVDALKDAKPSLNVRSVERTPKQKQPDEMRLKDPSTSLKRKIRERREKEFSDDGSTTEEESQRRLLKKRPKISNFQKQTDSEVHTKEGKEKEQKTRRKNPSVTEELVSLSTNKNLFRGYAFLITHVDPKEKDDDILFKLRDFDRNFLTFQIKASGGVVINSIKHCSHHPADKTILLAPFTQKTHKYYYAVASGIECVSHLWLINCAQEDKILPFHEYHLDAGEDIVNDTIVQYPDRLKPLRDVKVYMKVQPKTEEDVRAILISTGCEILERLPHRGIPAVDESEDQQSEDVLFKEVDSIFRDCLSLFPGFTISRIDYIAW
eukprot:gene5524-6209_t